jgi:hypothetical protein
MSRAIMCRGAGAGSIRIVISNSCIGKELQDQAKNTKKLYSF